MNILFVCTGNTCRSPMAEKTAENLFLMNNMNIKTSSRGMSVFLQQPASSNSIKVMKKNMLSLDEHMSKQITEKDIESADYILTMTQSHKHMLINEYPLFKDKFFTLKEAAGLSGDIQDPYGGSIEVYESCALEIKCCIEKIITLIKKKQASTEY